MNTIQQQIEQSQNVFTNFEELSDNLYKGEYTVEDKVAGIYYLNFNQEISKETFEELQYKYLAEEFYKQEEFLQWNIYMLFVNSDISDEVKLEILKDDKYARKLIFTNEEFLNYFSEKRREVSDLPDIISNWKTELTNVGLQELYSSASNDSVIRNFISGNVPTAIERTARNLDSVTIINQVSSISLKGNYRPFPSTREFQFGSVNLFTGSNGVGKTSLLESIELILTGRNQRNFDKKEDEGSVSAILNNSIIDSFSHNNNFYKDRGVKWYNRRLTELGNQTYKSFNQFNFFNTDAAHQFSNSDEVEKINDSLKQIILGEEFTTLKDKIEKIRIKLRPELNKTTKEIIDSNGHLESNKKRINELKNSVDSELLKQNIKLNISSLGYLNDVLESNYSITGLAINEIQTEIDIILSNKWCSDYNRFKKAKETISNRLKSVSTSRFEYETNNRKIIETKGEIKNSQNVVLKLEAFIKYLEIENVKEIETLESSLKKIESKLASINSLKEATKLKLDVAHLDGNIKSINELIAEKEIFLQNKRNLINGVEEDILKMEEKFSYIENLTTQIRLLGKELLEHEIHSDNCPLCTQPIHQLDLLLKIESEFIASKDKKGLEEKKDELLELKKETSLWEIELSNFKKFKSIISSNVTGSENKSLDELNHILKDEIDKENELLIERENKKSIGVQVANMGGSVLDYMILKNEIFQLKLSEDIFNKSYLLSIVSTMEGDIEQALLLIKNLSAENDEIIVTLNNELKFKDFTDNFEKIEGIVKSYEATIQSLSLSLESLRSYIYFADNKSFLEISKDISLLNRNLNTLKEIENNQSEIQNILSKNAGIDSYLDKLKPLNKRLNDAMRILDQLSSNSEDAILEGFFSENLVEIEDIFKTIHSPQEFTKLEYNGDTLVLYKEDGVYQISQISTGQRAALVLSIFISLNRKLKYGPNILVFDDPVTFIDDFNALSFLDFLRYFIVREKKQIFFATANKKFATLFKKKFDFLGGDDFREFHLER